MAAVAAAAGGLSKTISLHHHIVGGDLLMADNLPFLI